MNFTREPIIETIITPREGYKLVVRNSKNAAQEEYSVDAVEVVTFGTAQFYRSSERPKNFLLPVSDFEIVESRETRQVLKTPTVEKTIKIGGGKPQEEESAASETSQDKKRGRRQSRRRKAELRKASAETPAEKSTEEERGGGTGDETTVSSSVISRLLPPPPGLISDTLNKRIAEEVEESASTDPVEEIPLPKGHTPEESEPETEGPLPELVKEEEFEKSDLERQVPEESATSDHPPAESPYEEDEAIPEGRDPFTF